MPSCEQRGSPRLGRGPRALPGGSPSRAPCFFCSLLSAIALLTGGGPGTVPAPHPGLPIGAALACNRVQVKGRAPAPSAPPRSVRRHARSVYPPATFERRKQFGAPVYVSRHPGVTALIGDTLSSAREAIAKGGVREVHLVLLDADGLAVEQYGFAVDAALEPAVPVTLDEATMLFGGALTKLALLGTLVPALGAGRGVDSFTVALVCDRPADRELGTGASRVARLALAEGRLAAQAPGPGGAAPVPASGPALTEALWLRAGPRDPEVSLVPGSADPAVPLLRPLKVVEAGRVRVAVSWLGRE